MQTLSITPENLLKVFLGQPVAIETDHTGLLLLAAKRHDQPRLPTQMAGGIVYIEKQHPTLVALVHPFAVPENNGLFETDDHLIHREPFNWFGPQALVIEKKLQDFSNQYDGPRTATGQVPRAYIPDEIAEPVILSDHYWAAYASFVNDPDRQFRAQIKPLFSEH